MTDNSSSLRRPNGQQIIHHFRYDLLSHKLSIKRALHIPLILNVFLYMYIDMELFFTRILILLKNGYNHRSLFIFTRVTKYL